MQNIPIEKNHFYVNRNRSESNLYFKFWLKNVFFQRIASFAVTVVNTNIATAAYRKEFDAAMDYAKKNNERKTVKKFEKVQAKYNTVRKVSIAFNNYLKCGS